MQVKPIKTPIITEKDTDIREVLNSCITEITENSVIAVTSKIVSITEARVVPIANMDKDTLIAQEAQWYLPRSENPYGVSFTITQGNLVATAGIDESNAKNSYVLWPKDPQKSANEIRAHIRKKFGIKNFGVIITDSRTVPMRWGVTAFALAYSGFLPLKDYTGTQDLFGRTFVFEKLNSADGLATAAAFVMGEGAEQTPLAIITDIPHVTFVDADPSDEELKTLHIEMEKDLYGPFLQQVKWEKGEGK